MSSKSLYLKYITINQEIYQEDVALFLENIENITVDEAKILYYYIKKDFPLDAQKTKLTSTYNIKEQDLFHLDDKEGIRIKDYILSLCIESVKTVIYPVAGCYELGDINVEGCFVEKIDGKIIIGTTGPKISFGNANFINKYHMMFFLLKKYKFPKIS